jgi:hypothetical protein
MTAVKTRTKTKRYDMGNLSMILDITSLILKLKFDKCANTYVNIFVNDILNNEEILFVASTV